MAKPITAPDLSLDLRTRQALNAARTAATTEHRHRSESLLRAGNALDVLGRMVSDHATASAGDANEGLLAPRTLEGLGDAVTIISRWLSNEAEVSAVSARHVLEAVDSVLPPERTAPTDAEQDAFFSRLPSTE